MGRGLIKEKPNRKTFRDDIFTMLEQSPSIHDERKSQVIYLIKTLKLSVPYEKDTTIKSDAKQRTLSLQDWKKMV